MADYGYRVTRDSCGKNSKKETIGRSWELDEARGIMRSAAKKECESIIANDKKQAYAIEDSTNAMTIEIRTRDDGMLISYYEVEEFEHC